MNEALVIRPERPEDYGQIRMLLIKAFAQDNVAQLVELIRQSPNYVPDLALVGHVGETIVGYVMQSYVTLDDEGQRYEVLC
ncbi:MAG: N-acetyltransferase, partial [Chloroflexi bacterium]|nr:N-acetyltransferase [Chloroflexota bacterium]